MPKSPNRNTPRISRERALQISNDVSEDCVSATKAELIEVVRFWQNHAAEELMVTTWCIRTHIKNGKPIRGFARVFEGVPPK